MLAHDLRYTDDTDTIAVTVMDNTRAVTAHKDLNIVCWNIEQGLRLKSSLSCLLKVQKLHQYFLNKFERCLEVIL